MNEQEKQLLLKDLCARLPYGVKIYHVYGEKPVRFNSKHLNQIGAVKILPYLRPMSSMTEEEKAEYNLAADRDLDRMADKVGRKLQGDEKLDETLTPYYEHIDWLNKKMFDYRGLIPMGLALEAPKDMYKN